VALIGDRERERAAELLGREYVLGRLSVEELTERLDVTLSARRDSELRHALAGLRPGWREHVLAAREGLDGAWLAARRAAFVAALWALWWVVSLVLLTGFVASVVMDGLSWATAAIFAVLWLATTFAVRRSTVHRVRR
jgi:hypothetical protein